MTDRTMRERGAGAVEYLGVVVAVVVIIAGMSMTSAGGQIAGYIDQAICRVGSMLDGGACAAPEGESAEGPTFEPDRCTVSTAGSKEKVDVSIAIIDGGGSHGVAIAEVRHADGRVEYLVTQTGEGNLGVGVGIGGKGEGGKDAPGGGLSGDLSISGSYSGGPTYSVGSLEEAQALQSQLMSNPFANVGLDPTSETVTWGGEVEGSIDLGIALPKQNEYGIDDPIQDPLKAGIGGSLNGSHQYSTTTYPDGRTVYTTSWSGTIEGNGSAGPAGASGSWRGTTSVSITRGPDGAITGISFQTTTRGGSNLTVGDQGLEVGGNQNHAVVTTSTLAVDDSNRAVVEQWLGNQAGGDNYLGLAPLGTIFWDPTRQSTDPMINMLHNQAVVTQVTTDNYEDTVKYGGEVKWGIKLGASYTFIDSEGNVIDAQYAGAPVGGQRPWHNMEVCFP